ncbi:BREX system ATP-binding domain-containing protein [Desulfobacula sp.]|uniref:BREX system ATP-binding domain-containing protein n=1 Tax=Desulfobacula sp. TaxID=2593537 RepID=UPI0026081C25|nr:BREX system ATP-binding domain-containing protein [Desulfobacula sp.]
MDDLDFQVFLDSLDNFRLRRAVERLREGLFDPLGVQLLTTGETKLNTAFDRGVEALDRETPSHLCICGAYGQGKSHSLNFIKQRALARNFVVSYVNLDPRQVPFHDFKSVYRALMAAMEFPQAETSFVRVWKTRVAQWLALPENHPKTCTDLIPEEIPHRFKAILTAMAQKNMTIPAQKRTLKKHARFKPREFSWILKNALMGKNIPAWRLRSIFYYRQVPFYKEKPLACHEQGQYIAMVRGLANLFQNIGFKGWLVLFDEGESILQTRITCRSKSYAALNEIFYPETSPRGFYPVFAFTHDFFTHLADEDYDRVRIKAVNGTAPISIPYFRKNYSKDWKNIHIHTLQDLSPTEWEVMTHKLIQIHASAYQWKPPVESIQPRMNRKLSGLSGIEARLKIKFLVNLLDIEQQHQVLAPA